MDVAVLLAHAQQTQSHRQGHLSHQTDAGIALLLRHADGIAAEKLGQQQARLLDAPGLQLLLTK